MSLDKRDYDPFGNEPTPQLKKTFNDDLRAESLQKKSESTVVEIRPNSSQLIICGLALLAFLTVASVVYYQISSRKDTIDIKEKIQDQTRSIAQTSPQTNIAQNPLQSKKEDTQTLSSEGLTQERVLLALISDLNDFKSKEKTESAELKNFTELAQSLRLEKNRAETLFSIGVMLIDEGVNGSKNVQTGLKALELASEMKGADAMNRLGVIYVTGIYREKDNEKSEKYFILAAENGSKKALSNIHRLAESYLDGRNGFRQDKSKAIQLFRTSALYGNEESKSKLESLIN